MGNRYISGSFALYPIVVLWGEDFKRELPHVRFNISAGGAGKGIFDVLSKIVETQLRNVGLWEEVKDRLDASATRLSRGAVTFDNLT